VYVSALLSVVCSNDYCRSGSMFSTAPSKKKKKFVCPSAPFLSRFYLHLFASCANFFDLKMLKNKTNKICEIKQFTSGVLI
jgi:hypothetical protein